MSATADRLPFLEELGLGDLGPRLSTVDELYGIVGASRGGSLAPAVFNKAFELLGRPALYVPFHPSEFARFWDDVVLTGLPELGLPVRGLTVKGPHKEAALAVCSSRGGRASRAGAANCLYRHGVEWHGVNTTGAIDLLERIGMSPRGLRAAVVGCGGAGRAIAAELADREAVVTLVNRGAPRGRYASGLLGLPWVSLGDFRARGFEFVVNATPLVAELAFPLGELADEAVIADLAYRPDGETALITAARERGLVAVDGRQVLAAEMAAQFRLMTGEPLPPDAARVALG